MKKVWFLILAVLGLAIWFLSDKSLEQLIEPKASSKRRQAAPPVVSRASGMSAKFVAGQCVSRLNAEFNNIKIVAVEEDVYHIQQCRKYGGCLATEQVSWADFEHDYKIHKVVPCLPLH